MSKKLVKKEGRHPQWFMKTLIHGAMNNPELVGGGQWFNQANGWKQDSNGNYYQAPDENSEKLADHLNILGRTGIAGLLIPFTSSSYPLFTLEEDVIPLSQGAISASAINAGLFANEAERQTLKYDSDKSQLKQKVESNEDVNQKIIDMTKALVNNQSLAEYYETQTPEFKRNQNEEYFRKVFTPDFSLLQKRIPIDFKRSNPTFIIQNKKGGTD